MLMWYTEIHKMALMCMISVCVWSFLSRGAKSGLYQCITTCVSEGHFEL
jgi:hypothetical protein